MGNGNLIVPIERIENIEENIDELNTNYNRLNSDKVNIINYTKLLTFTNGSASFTTDLKPKQNHFLSCLMPNGLYCGNCFIDTDGTVSVSSAHYNMQLYSGEAWVNISGCVQLRS